MQDLYNDIIDPLGVTKDLLAYITECRTKGYRDTLVDLIFEFCRENNYDPEVLGDIIRDDFYFCEMIKADCKKHEIIVERGQRKPKIVEW